MSATSVERLTAREKLLAAANELFYAEGVHTVGIDRVIERAGVAKASLYNTFGSKDELVRAYLMSRHEARQRRLSTKIARYALPRDRILAVYDALGELYAEPGFRGCAFLNASGEAPAGGSVEEVSRLSRDWVRSLFVDLARELGVADPEQLGQQLVLLYDGATVAAQLDHSSSAAANARTVAAQLVDAATPAPAERPARARRG